jgi:hypothetical protein
MRWMPILIVALCCAAASPAHADSDAAAVATAAQGAGARAGKATLPRSARIAAMQLELDGALAAVEPAVRARLPEDVPGVWLIGPEQQRLAMRGGLQPAGGGNGSALIYPLSTTVSLGLRYRFLTDEDLVGFESAQSGSLRSDYVNHRFVVRARWQF